MQFFHSVSRCCEDVRFIDEFFRDWVTRYGWNGCYMRSGKGGRGHENRQIFVAWRSHLMRIMRKIVENILVQVIVQHEQILLKILLN